VRSVFNTQLCHSAERANSQTEVLLVTSPDTGIISKGWPFRGKPPIRRLRARLAKKPAWSEKSTEGRSDRSPMRSGSNGGKSSPAKCGIRFEGEAPTSDLAGERRAQSELDVADQGGKVRRGPRIEHDHLHPAETEIARMRCLESMAATISDSRLRQPLSRGIRLAECVTAASSRCRHFSGRLERTRSRSDG
jgi:hypothetical protein